MFSFVHLENVSPSAPAHWQSATSPADVARLIKYHILIIYIIMYSKRYFNILDKNIVSKLNDLVLRINLLVYDEIDGCLQ